MSDYSLVQKTVMVADETTGAGVSPLDFTLPSSVKTTSAFIVSSVRDERHQAFVQRGQEAFVQATVFPFTVNLGTAVNFATAEVRISFRDSRIVTPTLRGIRARLINAGADIEFDAAALGAAETIDVDWEVIEHKKPRAATVRLLDADNVRLEWDGTLVAGEEISASIEVWDIENLGDDLKEILFRQQRLLAMAGENAMQDLIVLDTQGNMLSYRVRGFDTKANLDAATKDIAGAQPLEAGEAMRITVTQDIKDLRNDRILLTKGRTDLLSPTPGVN